MSLLQNTVTLSSSDVLNLYTTPVNIVSAQGTGTAINPITIVFKYNFNTTGLYPSGTQLTTSYGGQPSNSLNDVIGPQGIFYDNNNNIYTSNQVLLYNTSGSIFQSETNITNQPLQLTANGIIDCGALNTATISYGGNNYAVGDTGNVLDLNGNTVGTYTVTSVDENGAVTGIDLPTGGIGFFVTGPVPVSTVTGSGQSLYLVVSSINEVFDGSFDVTTTYMVHNV